MTVNPTPAAVWYLVSDAGAPLGQVYRKEGEAEPQQGHRLSGDAHWDGATVASFTELSPTCLIRRFRVVVKLQPLA
jgi:hypothetical protein